MLQLENQRKSVRSDVTPSAVFIASSDDNGGPSSSVRTRGEGRQQNYNARRNNNWSGDKRGGQHQGGNRFNNGGGSGTASRFTAASVSLPPTYPYWAPQPPYPYWSPPPCPYPTQAGWAAPWSPTLCRGAQPSPRSLQYATPLTGQAHVTVGENVEPTALGSDFNAMTLQAPDYAQRFMDTGASSHLTADPDWDYDYEEH
ncbi:hypothetical protein RND81_10G033600 [Saponaria officinalis]|uniref:Uncharacterized protein n=1 Tax=Saponaria officinalis TaxID=3572 RepID=A0AAW1HXS5_SAPOF